MLKSNKYENVLKNWKLQTCFLERRFVDIAKMLCAQESINIVNCMRRVHDQTINILCKSNDVERKMKEGYDMGAS